jgi:thioredoxin-related protein
MKKKYLFILILPLLWVLYAVSFSDPWLSDFEEAKKNARETHKPVLLYFSGSDWCGVCIRMKKEIYESDAFKSYASSNLILMVADFPRQKKNRLSDEVNKQNESLADQYNPNGVFPSTILLSPDLKVIRKWEGKPDMSAEAFVEELKKCRKPL